MAPINKQPWFRSNSNQQRLVVFSLFFGFMKLSISSWNSRVCANCEFSCIFCEYNWEFKPNIVGLLETRVISDKADAIIAKLGFQFSHQVEAIGFSGSIWIAWKESARVEVVCNHSQFILIRIFDNSFRNSLLVSSVLWQSK